MCLLSPCLQQFFRWLLGQRSKPRSHVFASSLTASNTKRANLTLEIIHCGHTWHVFPWPWVSLTWLLYNLQLDNVTCADFENWLYPFGRSEKSSMYNKHAYHKVPVDYQENPIICIGIDRTLVSGTAGTVFGSLVDVFAVWNFRELGMFFNLFVYTKLYS